MIVCILSVSNGVVSGLHVFNVTSTSVAIVWSDVPCRQRGGSLLWYDVEISPVNATNASQILQTNVAYMNVIGLSPATFYTVHIRYVNNAGAGNFSEYFQFQTSESGMDAYSSEALTSSEMCFMITFSATHSAGYRRVGWGVHSRQWNVHCFKCDTSTIRLDSFLQKQLIDNG